MNDLLKALRTEKGTLEDRVHSIGVALHNSKQYPTPYTDIHLQDAKNRLSEVLVAMNAIITFRLFNSKTEELATSEKTAALLEKLDALSEKYVSEQIDLTSNQPLMDQLMGIFKLWFEMYRDKRCTWGKVQDVVTGIVHYQQSVITALINRK